MTTRSAPLRQHHYKTAATPTGAPQTAELRLGDISLQPGTLEATLAGAPLPLTHQEFQLLALLAENADRLVPTETITYALWQDLHPRHSRQLGVLISRLRKKLAPCREYEIETVRKRGYRLQPQHAS